MRHKINMRIAHTSVNKTTGKDVSRLKLLKQ